MATASTAPVRDKHRIKIIDSIRGVALLGILMMNIPYFGNPHHYESLNVLNEYSGPNYYTWWVVSGFFEGTMRALFSLLFGAGCLLLLNRLEKKTMDSTPADVYYRRLLWLFIFGLINAFIFQWPGDILYFYAICGLFLFPFRNLKAKHLFLFATAFFLIATIKGTYFMYKSNQMRVKGEHALVLEKQKKTLTEEQKGAKEEWVGYQAKSKPEALKKEAEKEIKAVGQSGYFGSFAYLAGVTAMFESSKFYHFIFFDIMCLLFLGMALFKWGVLTGKRSTKFYWLVLLIAYPVGLALSYWQHSTIVSVRFDRTQLFNQMYVDLYQFRRTFLALGHLSVLMLVYKYGIFKWLLDALARVGQMAFTNYLMQSIICITIFNGFGFGMFGKLQRYELYYVVGSIWLFQIVFSSIWLRYYRFGPFEWVWRSLTYWKKQPMKKRKAEDTEEETAGEQTPVPAIA